MFDFDAEIVTRRRGGSPVRLASTVLVLVMAQLFLPAAQAAASNGEGPYTGRRESRAHPVPVAHGTAHAYSVAMRPERDKEDILRDTFNEAAGNRTAGPLINFIMRNPDHPLAAKARLLIKDGGYAPARKTASEWVDSKIVEFDEARRAGAGPLKAFIAKYPDHPLAAEARRWLPGQ